MTRTWPHTTDVHRMSTDSHDLLLIVYNLRMRFIRFYMFSPESRDVAYMLKDSHKESDISTREKPATNQARTRPHATDFHKCQRIRMISYEWSILFVCFSSDFQLFLVSFMMLRTCSSILIRNPLFPQRQTCCQTSPRMIRTWPHTTDFQRMSMDAHDLLLMVYNDRMVFIRLWRMSTEFHDVA